MRSYGANTQLWLTGRKPIVSRILIWITARDRSTNANATIGFWNGDDHETITVNGVPRLYYAAGNILTVDALTLAAGLDVRTWSITFSYLSDEINTAVRTYDAKHAPVEVHQVFFNPDTGLMLDAPVRIFKGQIAELSFSEGAFGNQSSIKMELESIAIDLTRNSTLKKSDESYKLRSGDRIFKYADISGAVQVVWGTRVQPAVSQPAASQSAANMG